MGRIGKISECVRILEKLDEMYREACEEGREWLLGYFDEHELINTPVQKIPSMRISFYDLLDELDVQEDLKNEFKESFKSQKERIEDVITAIKSLKHGYIHHNGEVIDKARVELREVIH